jgi:hypothetical protein
VTRHLAPGRRLGRWLSRHAWLPWLSLLAAGAALAIPGPTSDLSGIASILAVAGLALVAGHAWGKAIAGVASTTLVAHVWPIVATGQHSGWGTFATSAALLCALPAVVLFAATLPRSVPRLLGRFARTQSNSAAASVAILATLVALPLFDHPALRETRTAIAAATPRATRGPQPMLASADRDAQPVTPRARQTLDLDIHDRPAAAPTISLDVDAKAIASDAAHRVDLGAAAAYQALDLVRVVLTVGYDEARRRLAEQQLVDAISGAGWQPDVDAEPALAGDGALGDRDQ